MFKTLSKLQNLGEERLEQIKSGIQVGFPTGYSFLDKRLGLPQRGQLWVFGGYNGVGKSYFALNLVNGFLFQQDDLKIGIFTTEMPEEDYYWRWVCLETGCWELDAKENTNELGKNLNKLAERYWKNVKIRKVHEYENMASMIKSGKFDIVIIDFIQQLVVGDLYDEKKKMGILSTEISNLLQETGTVGIVLSQMNNYSLQDNGNSPALTGLSYGKMLNYYAHVTAILSRRWNKKGETLPLLDITVKKARSGQVGEIVLKIEEGYQLEQVSSKEIEDILLEHEVLDFN